MIFFLFDSDDVVEEKRADNQLVSLGPKWDISCHNHLKSVSICQRRRKTNRKLEVDAVDIFHFSPQAKLSLKLKFFSTIA